MCCHQPTSGNLGQADLQIRPRLFRFANNPWKQQESQPVIPDAGQEQPDNSENQTVQPNAPDNEENEQPLNPGEGSSDAEDVPEV